MGRPRIFTTLPTGAIGDDRLHALDLRALAVIALHDGMSLSRGTGAGCFAKHQTLAAEIGVDIARFSKALRRLKDFGYVLIEQQGEDRRRKTMRVIYPKDGRIPLQQSRGDSAAEMVAMQDNQLVDMVDSQTGEIVDICDFETRRNPPKTDAQYIPLRGEIDSVETGEIDSIEMAHLNGACDDVDASRMIHGTISGLSNRARPADLPTSGISIYALLPDSFKDLPEEAQLSHLERALKRLDWDDSRLIPEHRATLRRNLERIWAQSTTASGPRAERMLINLELHEQEAAE